MWIFSRHVTAMPERSDAYDVFDRRAGEDAVLFFGVVVDAPSLRQFQVLSRVEKMIRSMQWDGARESIFPALDELCSRVVADDMVAQTGIKAREGGGVSIGGLCRANGGSLVAFRIGRFRLVVGDRIALHEETLHREELERGFQPEDVQLFQPPSRCLPSDRIRETDLVWIENIDKPVSMFHAKPFDLERKGSNPRIDISAEWR
ncbi:MAG: hypothetical protein ABIQ65_12255 [Thermoanaerobaculia bacterium]